MTCEEIAIGRAGVSQTIKRLVGTSALQIIEPDPNRISIIIQNVAPLVPVYFREISNLTSFEGYILTPESRVVIMTVAEFGSFVTGPIYAVAVGGSAEVVTTELFSTFCPKGE